MGLDDGIPFCRPNMRPRVCLPRGFVAATRFLVAEVPCNCPATTDQDCMPLVVARLVLPQRFVVVRLLPAAFAALAALFDLRPRKQQLAEQKM